MKQFEKKDLSATLQTVSKVASASGIPSWVTGSYVRDLLSQNENSRFSIACDGDPLALAKALLRELPGAALQGTKRSQNAQLDHASGSITIFSIENTGSADKTICAHLESRDFTINAMAIALSAKHFGELIDPCTGRADFAAGIIRTTGEAADQFQQYPLRMMKALTLSAELEFTIAEDAWSAISEKATAIGKMPAQRLTAEFRKLLMVKQPSLSLDLLLKSGLSAITFPELDKMTGIEQREEYQHKDVFYHTLQVVDNISRHTDRFELRFAALMHDIAKPQTKRFVDGVGWTFHGHEELGARMTQRIGRRMRLPKETIEYVAKLVRLHLRPIALVGSAVTDSAIRRLMTEAGDQIDDLMMLCRADITSKNSRKVERYLTNFDKVEERMAEVREKDRLRKFQPAITGQQIMDELNIEAGPLVGQIKKAIRAAVLNEEIPNEPESCLNYMRAIKDRFI